MLACLRGSRLEPSTELCVLRAHGGAGYTFGALAILVVLPPGRKPSRAQLSQKRAGHRLCHPPPGPAAIIRGAPGRLGVAQCQRRGPDPGGELSWRGARGGSEALAGLRAVPRGPQRLWHCWLLGYGLRAASGAGPHPALSSAWDRVLGAPGVAGRWLSGARSERRRLRAVGP